MQRRLTALSLIALIALALPAAPALAQDPADNEKLVRLKPKEGGWKVTELFESINDATGKSILYDPKAQQINTAKIEFVGDALIPEDKLFQWLQAVLAYHKLVLVPVGPKNSRGEQQWFAMDSANPALQSRPVYVPEEELEDYADRDGLYVVTSIKLKHISDTSRVRSALSQLSTRTAAVGKVVDIQGSRSLIVADFAPMAAAVKRLLRFIDQPNPIIEPRMEVVQLQYAVASELEPIISDLIQQSRTTGSSQGNRRGNQPAAAGDEPEPKLIADDRLDAIIIYATENDQRKIKELIEKLDVPNPNFRSRLNFVPLKHTNAEDIADLISELIAGISEAAASGGAASRSSRNTTRRPSAGAGAGAALAASLGEGDPVIIPDPNSNALIIHASPTQFEGIEKLIQKLDKSRPQVMIETAMVELAVDDNLRLGVELFQGSDEIGIDTTGDGILDTITDTARGFGSSAFGDVGNIADVAGTNVALGLRGGGALGLGVTAGIYKDGQLAGILTAFQQAGKAKVVTMPSIVTNDNMEATLELTEDTSYRETVRTDTGTDRDSFQTVSATTTLTISPHISSDNYLRLEIDQAIEAFRGTPPVPGAPPDKVERRITTNVTLPDKATVVLGGLIQERESSQVQKVPFLGDIPILGFFFRTSEDQSQPQHLFIFVTPHILRDTTTFADYKRLSLERKLTMDDLFGEEVDLHDAKWSDGTAPVTEARIRELEESGALDGGRLKSPPESGATRGADRVAEDVDAMKKEDGDAEPEKDDDSDKPKVTDPDAGEPEKADDGAGEESPK